MIVETYAVLTRLPPPHRLAPATAVRLMHENLAKLRVVTLDGVETWRLVDDLARSGVAGGRSCDAIVVACAARAKVDRVLTLNRRHFEALVPAGIAIECPIDE